jgi:hypothetical protein
MHHLVAAELPPSVATEMLDMIRCPVVVNVRQFIVARLVSPFCPESFVVVSLSISSSKCQLGLIFAKSQNVG